MLIGSKVLRYFFVAGKGHSIRKAAQMSSFTMVQLQTTANDVKAGDSRHADVVKRALTEKEDEQQVSKKAKPDECSADVAVAVSCQTMY
jgi:activator of HSP90 ATPase